MFKWSSHRRMTILEVSYLQCMQLEWLMIDTGVIFFSLYTGANLQKVQPFLKK